MGVGATVFVVVILLLAYALYRGRQKELADALADIPPVRDEERGVGRRFVLLGGAVIPALILISTFGYTLFVLNETDPGDTSDLMQIEVIGHQWWWEVRYPGYDFITANEIHIPAGEPVELILTSADVIHSVWIPQLHGVVDMIPGHTNRLKLDAFEPGIFRGECTEYCGIQHAKMFLFVVAEPRADFDAWVLAQQQAAPDPTDPLLAQGKDLYFAKGCDNCHRIDGTASLGKLGPDLTHFASRLTLGAGILENNRGNLAGWILDPQSIKLGSLMPLTDYSGPELQAVLAYLESLE